jgi:hypothetical protein
MTEHNDTNGNGAERKPRGTRKGKGNIPLETKAEMVAALPELGAQAAVAREFGVSDAVVSRAVSNPEVVKLAKVKKEEIAAGFASLTQKLLKRYEDLADSATLTDKGVILLGICADKALLYAGEPTAITESRNDATLREDALKMLAEYRAALNGDEAKARELLAQDAPTLSQYVN